MAPVFKSCPSLFFKGSALLLLLSNDSSVVVDAFAPSSSLASLSFRSGRSGLSSSARVTTRAHMSMPGGPYDSYSDDDAFDGSYNPGTPPGEYAGEYAGDYGPPYPQAPPAGPPAAAAARRPPPPNNNPMPPVAGSYHRPPPGQTEWWDNPGIAEDSLSNVQGSGVQGFMTYTDRLAAAERVQMQQRGPQGRHSRGRPEARYEGWSEQGQQQQQGMGPQSWAQGGAAGGFNGPTAGAVPPEEAASFDAAGRQQQGVAQPGMAPPGPRPSMTPPPPPPGIAQQPAGAGSVGPRARSSGAGPQSRSQMTPRPRPNSNYDNANYDPNRRNPNYDRQAYHAYQRRAQSVAESNGTSRGTGGYSYSGDDDWWDGAGTADESPANVQGLGVQGFVTFTDMQAAKRRRR